MTHDIFADHFEDGDGSKFKATRPLEDESSICQFFCKAGGTRVSTLPILVFLWGKKQKNAETWAKMDTSDLFLFLLATSIFFVIFAVVI